MAVELDTFRAICSATGTIELERAGTLIARGKLQARLARWLGFPVGIQRRAAVVALVGLIQRDYPDDASQLFATANISLVDLTVSVKQLKALFVGIDQLAITKPNPQHFIETVEILSELVGRAVNHTLSEMWVFRAAARLEALGLADPGERYLSIAVEAAVEDQIAGRLVSRETVTNAIIEDPALSGIAKSSDKERRLATKLAQLLSQAHHPSAPGAGSEG